MLKVFAIVNAGIVAVSYVGTFFSHSLACLWSFEFVKSVALVKVMDSAAHKPRIAPSAGLSVIAPTTFYAYTASTCLVKSVLHYHLASPDIAAASMIAVPIFLIKSFAFEVIFDLVHYWMHRSAHAHPLLYRWVHKTHHSFGVCAEASLCMSPLDVVISYCIPFYVAYYCCVFGFSPFELQLLSTYLTYQEIGGHLNKYMRPTSSFAQCVWLPRWLGIELYTEDHDKHHSLNNCNFSKRFSLWDKLFGTFKPSSDLALEPVQPALEPSSLSLAVAL